MGGRDTIKGVKAQGMIAVLESISRDDWDIVRIEPEKHEEITDKIDIQWDLKDAKHKIAQVKSTEIPMMPAQIKSFLNELIKENHSPENLYELHIVGPLHKKSHELVSRINNREVRDQELNGFEFLEQSVDSSKIFFREFDFQSLEALAYKLLHQFYNKNNIPLQANEVELRTKALLNEFDVLPIYRKDLSRRDMENILIAWTDRFSIGTIDIKNLQELKDSVTYLAREFRRLLGLMSYPFPVSGRITRLNYVKEHEKAFTLGTVQKKYLNIMIELEELEEKRSLLLKYQADYEVGKKSGTSNGRLIPLANKINNLSELLDDKVENSKTINEFHEYLDEFIKNIYS
ncbi:hypothetical protein SAMN05428987_5251 [Paenibacillus sp. CF095]|uniref:hypothetical protein n=1 Tax=Paenibacillus sp. CF095 TaxID=1881033 RepID=UPI00088797AB|nr:hypothetical protein [Paenibacillus sp. CF095]SDD55033.1 hypothetical protein SAMN05428987_5251 [Paenibacillus sp. CF095]